MAGLFAAPAAAPAAKLFQDRPLVLVVNSDDTTFSWARVREAVWRALAIPVIADDHPGAAERLGTLTIAWRPTRHELAVTYEDQRGVISRVVPAPARPDEGIQAAVALAVNLVRDQVADLLADHAAAPEPSPPPDPPPARPGDELSRPAISELAPVFPERPSPAVAAVAGPRAQPPVLSTVAPLPPPRFMLALLAGVGAGWASGTGEVTGNAASPPGLALARAGHLVPEAGYFVSPRLLLSLQARLQLVSGPTELYLPPDVRYGSACGGDYVCSPPRTAFAGFLKASLFARPQQEAIRHYLSLGVGGGTIRYVATSPVSRDCGPSRQETCVDSYTAAKVMATAGIGVHARIWRRWDLVAAAQLALAVYRFSFTLDANVGVASSF